MSRTIRAFRTLCAVSVFSQFERIAETIVFRARFIWFCRIKFNLEVDEERIMKTSPRLLVAPLLITLGSFGTLFSQSSTGSISGIVVDERQAVIAGATVAIRNTATGFALSATTNSDGRYRFVNIPIGTYEVTAEALNFSKYVQQGITLDVNQDAVVDAVLKAGNVQETVTVTENASVLNTTTAEI